ncbi:MAG TPA: ParA family protein [Parafilimonas sp.]|nr:ParA family protein [Parafilimonas sp.]
MAVFALYNLKGGVGKTAAAINLAYLSAADGYKTLIWDLDPQGSSSFYLGVKANNKNETKKLFAEEIELKDAIQSSAFENLRIIPADISARNIDTFLSDVKHSRKKVKSLLSDLKGYDIIILDCPPGISLLHENIFNAANWILMPNIPTTLSINSFETVMEYFKNNELDEDKIKCFFSMVDHRKNLHHEVMQQFYKDKLFFKSYIPYLSDVEKMGVHQQPLFEYANSSYAAQCFRDLWKEVKKVCL